LAIQKTGARESAGQSFAILITIIGGIAKFERELIRTRTGDGFRRAKRLAFTWSERRS
jgi:DNA invertase Pin-like site-specific DNA recombinase